MHLKSKLLYDFDLIHLHYNQKNKKILEPFYETNGQTTKHIGRIVFMCDGRIRSGGLSDRLHGIISLYKYCMVHKLDFKVNFCDPFDLCDYLEPNDYYWKINQADLQYNLNASKPMLIACSSRSNGATLEQELASQLRYLDKIISRNTDKEFHIYTNMHYAYTPEIYSNLFHILFRPSKALSDKLEVHRKNIGGKYVSVTLRFQNLLGDFKEGDFPTLSKASQEDLIQTVKNKIMDIHDTRHPNEKLLVTSDSRHFLDVVADLEYVYTIPGNLVHMSYTPIHSFTTHLKSFVDLMMLANAEKLYLLVTGNMYRSGFAESASFINNRPYEVIEW